jgi:hypothetical protein
MNVMGSSKMVFVRKYADAPYVPVAYSRMNMGRSKGKASMTDCAGPNMLAMNTIVRAPK